MRSGLFVRNALKTVGRALALGPILFAVSAGSLLLTAPGCDGGANTSGKNEVVPVDAAKTQKNQDMIKNMYQDKKAAPAKK